MFDNLFGTELPLVAKFVMAFVVVLALIAVTFWLIRRLGADRVGAGQARGRQPRLAVIDAAAVDSRRRLVLIRRDNIEHLVMIGGPSDLVIEQNIVRAVPVSPARDAPPARPPGETVARGTDMVRDVPPPRAAAADASWAPPPLPEGSRSRSEAPSRSAEPARQLPDSLSPSRAAMPEPRQPSTRPPLDLPPVEMRQSPPTADVNLADMAQRLEAALRRPGPPPAERVEAPPPPRPAPREPQARAAPPPSPRPAPSAEAPAQPIAPRPPQPRTPPVAEQPRPSAPPAEPQRPAEPPRAEPSRPEPAPQANAVAAAETPPPAAVQPSPPPAEPAAAPARPASSKSVFDSLEEEMASLLGKPDKP